MFVLTYVPFRNVNFRVLIERKETLNQIGVSHQNYASSCRLYPHIYNSMFKLNLL